MVWRELGGNHKEGNAGTGNRLSSVFAPTVRNAWYDARTCHRGISILRSHRARAWTPHYLLRVPAEFGRVHRRAAQSRVHVFSRLRQTATGFQEQNADVDWHDT